MQSEKLSALSLRKRQAHRYLRLSGDYCRGLFTAGVVAARAAVQLVRRLELTHFAQHLVYFGVGGLGRVAVDRQVILAHDERVERLEIEVAVAGIRRDRHIVLDRRTVVFFHDRTADTAARAGRHLDEAIVDLAALDVLQRLDAVLDAVDCHVCIARCTVHERFQNSAGRREETRETFGSFIHTGFKLDVLLFQPFGQLLECQNRVDHAAGEVGFVFLRHARTDEHGLCLGTSTLDIGAVSVHRRHNVGKIAEYIREIFLDKQVYRMTAGRNYNVAMFVCEQLLVFGLDNRSSDRGLLDIIETELLYSLAHRFDADAVVIGNERRREADVYRRA